MIGQPISYVWNGKEYEGEIQDIIDKQGVSYSSFNDYYKVHQTYALCCVILNNSRAIHYTDIIK